MSKNDKETNDGVTGDDQNNSSSLDIKKKLGHELETMDLGKFTKSEIRELSDLLSPYL